MASLPPVGKDQEEAGEALSRLTGGIVWLAENGDVLHVNERFMELFSATFGALKQANWTRLDEGFEQLDFSSFWRKLCAEHYLRWETRLRSSAESEDRRAVAVEAVAVEHDFCRHACLRVMLIDEIRSSRHPREMINRPDSTVNWTWDMRAGTMDISDNYRWLFALPERSDRRPPRQPLDLLDPYLNIRQLEELKEQLGALRRREREHIELRWLLPLANETKMIVFRARPVERSASVTVVEGSFEELRPLEGRRLRLMAAEIVENSRDSLLILDRDFLIVYVNAAACRNLGYELEEIVHMRHVFDVDIEQDRADWRKISRASAGSREIELETSFQRKDGTVFPVRVSVSRYEDGEEVFVPLLVRDISRERKEVSTLQPALIQQRLISSQLRQEKYYLQEELARTAGLENIVSAGESYGPILNQLQRVAGTDATVLIEGETGTGKELLARAIHYLSERNERTMIRLNCAGLPADLIESELFGHEKGAFTGAVRQKKGRFELADKGTLFLDEIGEMPLHLQTRLLRVLQEGEFERVGGTEVISVDVRIIAATNRNLADMVAAGTFREDLFYRLNVFPIRNPPLRERREDIPVLVGHFLAKYGKKMNRAVESIRAKDMDRLMRYDFPGNIRELENIIERSLILSEGTYLNLYYWEPEEAGKVGAISDATDRGAAASIDAGFPTLEELQRAHILAALERTHWRVSGSDGAARLLGLKDQTLFSRMRKLGIKR